MTHFISFIVKPGSDVYQLTLCSHQSDWGIGGYRGILFIYNTNNITPSDEGNLLVFRNYF